MNLCIYSTQASAQALSDAVDVSMGYPLAGKDIGGGVHAPPSQSVTTRWSVILAHPTLPQWGYVADGAPAAILLAKSAPATTPATGAWLTATQAAQVGAAT